MNEDYNTTDPDDLDDSIITDDTDDAFVLTTIDNPYSPKTEYDKWKQFDHDNGHDTAEYIARLISMEDNVNVDDTFKMNMLTSKVIDDILLNDDQGIYRLVRV